MRRLVHKAGRDVGERILRANVMEVVAHEQGDPTPYIVARDGKIPVALTPLKAHVWACLADCPTAAELTAALVRGLPVDVRDQWSESDTAAGARREPDPAAEFARQHGEAEFAREIGRIIGEFAAAGVVVCTD
jgi:hypothetical protein